MFKWLNKQGVEKEGAFFLQRMTRFTYEYGEGAERLTVPVEPGAKYEEIYLSKSTGAEFDPERVAAHIAEALAFMGVRAEIR